jgi:uncharacterized membrane protein YcjF (UPF0283 family)
MGRVAAVVVLIVSAAGALWSIVVVINAVSRSEGQGGIFWSAVALIVLTTIALLFLAKRSFEALRRRLPHRHRRGSEAAPRVRGEHRLWIDVATVERVTS